MKLAEAKGRLGLMTARMTYVIDNEGTIRKALRHDFAVGKHLPAVIDALKSIQGS